MNHILCQMFKIILSNNHIRYSRLYLEEAQRKKTGNHTIKTYTNRIENGIKFNIETGYYLQFLMPKTMKLIEGFNNKTTKDKNGKYVSHLEITECIIISL